MLSCCGTIGSGLLRYDGRTLQSHDVPELTTKISLEPTSTLSAARRYSQRLELLESSRSRRSAFLAEVHVSIRYGL